MIKKFNDFLNENYTPDEHNSIGEYIEVLANDDEYIRNLANQYLEDIDPSIRLSSAINVLDDLKKVELLKRVENWLNGYEGEVDVKANVEIVEESYGKSVVNTFFKCITALGQKDINAYKETPNDFLIYFKTELLDSKNVEMIFSRFKSLSQLDIDYSRTNLKLYYGITIECKFEYGYFNGEEDLVIGEFDLKKTNLNSLKTSTNKSTSNLRRIISDLSHLDIKLLCVLKTEFENFDPGYFKQKMIPNLDGRMITFGYYGWGSWSNGQIESTQLDEFKIKVKEFLSKFKWSEKIQLAVKSDNFWIFINIRIK
jgi:hypothetical protein